MKSRETDRIETLRPARPDSPSVALHRASSGSFVRKSYAHCPLLLRETIGRIAIGREQWALQRLQNSRHAPSVLARPNRFTIDLEYIEGRALEDLKDDHVDRTRLAAQADSLLSDLRQAGVVHGDLGHDHWQSMGRECNLIWTSDERLVAIDFAGSLSFGSKLPLAKPLAYALHQHDDLLRAKIAHHFPPATIEPLACPEWPVELWSLLRLLGKL